MEKETGDTETIDTAGEARMKNSGLPGSSTAPGTQRSGIDIRKQSSETATTTALTSAALFLSTPGTSEERRNSTEKSPENMIRTAGGLVDHFGGER